MRASHVDARPQPAIPVILSPAGPPRPLGPGPRALLLGDAIHPYLPNLGQGACQAIEDAHVLGIMLAQGLEDQPLLTRYQSARARRTAMLGRDSVRLGRFAQAGGPTSSRLRDLALRSVPDCTRGGHGNSSA